MGPGDGTLLAALGVVGAFVLGWLLGAAKGHGGVEFDWRVRIKRQPDRDRPDE